MWQNLKKLFDISRSFDEKLIAIQLNKDNIPIHSSFIKTVYDNFAVIHPHHKYSCDALCRNGL